MLGLTKVGLRPLGGYFQAVRTFIPLRNGQTIPTVYEALPKRRGGKKAMTFLKEQLLEKFDTRGNRRKLVDRNSEDRLRAGDIIRVHFRDRTNVLGQIIDINRCGTATNLLLRNKITRLGCEMRIPIFNPSITNIEIVEKPKKYLARSKHYYIRNTRLDVQDLEVAIKK